MLNTLKKHKYKTIGCLFLITMGSFALYTILKPTPEINVAFQKGIYEYGTQVNIQEMVLEVTPKDASIVYPKLNIKDVGNYETSFRINNTEFAHSFIVTDTQMPVISLEMDDKLEVLEGIEYKILSNVVSVSDPVDGDITTYEKLSSKEFETMLQQVDAQRTIVNARLVGTTKEKAEEKLSNLVYYKTDLDLKKTGTYSITLIAIDSNYNVMEKSWSIEVKPKGSIVNTGGVVECNSSKSLNEEYAQIDTMQKTTYGINEKLVSVEYNQTYVLTSNPLYFNVYDLYRETLAAYDSLSSKDGVEVNVQIINETKVKVTVLIYLETYKAEDSTIPFIQQLNDKSTLESILKDAKANQFVCDASY